MTKVDALAALDGIEILIRGFGSPYESEHREFKRLISQLRAGPLQGPYFREKLANLDGWADVGFSARKYAKYPGGLQAVMVWALGDLGSARSLVEDHWAE